MTIDAHSTFGVDGGLAAVSNTQHGVGLVELASNGAPTWLARDVALAPGGQPTGHGSRTSVGVTWLDDEYLLSVDGERGLEVLRLQR